MGLGNTVISKASELPVTGTSDRGNRAKQLTESKVREILTKHSAGASQHQLAKEYDVSTTAIGYVVNNQTWKHIERVAQPTIKLFGPGSAAHRQAITTHGHSYSRTYSSWKAMTQRCLNPNHPSWKYYGGIGVTVCDRWKDFKLFLEDMGERPVGTSIDRYPNPAGNYEPGNCRWATAEEQAQNKREFPLAHFIGVSKLGSKWRSRFCLNGKRQHIGVFDTELEAALARDEKVIEYQTGARLNLPQDAPIHTDAQVDSALLTLLSAVAQDPSEDPSTRTRTRAIELVALLATGSTATLPVPLAA